MSQIPYLTSDTKTAAYLVLKGFNLLGIQYEPRQNGKKRGFFIFEGNGEIQQEVNQFESGDVSLNFTEYQNTLSELIDRVVRELP